MRFPGFLFFFFFCVADNYFFFLQEKGSKTEVGSEILRHCCVTLTSQCIAYFASSIWQQTCDLFTLVVFFSKSQWRRSISHLLSSSPLFFFCSDVDGVIPCLSRSLYQHGTITVNLVNVYKVQSCAAGLCSLCLVFLRLSFFVFSYTFLCMCLKRNECVFVCSGEEYGVSRRCAAVQGGGFFNKCMLMSEAATMRRMRRAVVIYCCVCAQQRIPGRQMALRSVMNEH